MKRIFPILLIILIFFLCLSFASAKEDTHFEIEKDPSGYSAVITLKDSSNNPISNQKFSIDIKKPNGYIKTYPTKKTNKHGQCSFFLGSNKGEYIITVSYKGNDKYNPCDLVKSIKVTKGSKGSAENYYQNHNYGDNVVMDDYIYDNYWDEEIYDDPYYDYEWY